FVVHDFEPGYDTYTEKPGYSWDADLAFADVQPADYVALVIPGGRAPDDIRRNPNCQRIIRHFFEQEKPVAQLSHAPLALSAPGGPLRRSAWTANVGDSLRRTLSRVQTIQCVVIGRFAPGSVRRPQSARAVVRWSSRSLPCWRAVRRDGAVARAACLASLHSG